MSRDSMSRDSMSRDPMSRDPMSRDPMSRDSMSRAAQRPDHAQVPLVRLLSMAVAVGLDELHEELAAAGHPDLRPVHGFALNAVRGGARTASELARALRMTKQGAAKIAGTLVARGYLEPVPAAGDARAKPLTLTARGRAAIEASEAIQERIERRWAAAVGDDVVRAVRAGLLSSVLAENGGRLPSPRPAW
jgi:DNA-binding MarR family transcriptional regulator